MVENPLNNLPALHDLCDEDILRYAQDDGTNDILISFQSYMTLVAVSKRTWVIMLQMIEWRGN
jgi:hypothetical protein